MLGRVMRKKTLPAAGAEHQRGLLFVRALRLHQRNQLARHEGEGDEGGGEDDTGHGENDAQIVIGEPGSKPALRAENEHIDQIRR